MKQPKRTQPIAHMSKAGLVQYLTEIVEYAKTISFDLSMFPSLPDKNSTKHALQTVISTLESKMDLTKGNRKSAEQKRADDIKWVSKYSADELLSLFLARALYKNPSSTGAVQLLRFKKELEEQAKSADELQSILAQATTEDAFADEMEDLMSAVDEDNSLVNSDEDVEENESLEKDLEDEEITDEDIEKYLID